MLETEALKKWCPFSRTGTENGDSINRYAPGYGLAQECLCIGSQCMAWRPSYESGNGHGYCGLAGRPDE